MMDFFKSPLMVPMWYALLSGAIVGLERELKKKDAGIKTSAFVCVGACIYTFISTRGPHADPTRVIAQIVSGIGFLGGGVIIFNRDKLQGLTSATIIWMTASIGILCGLNYYHEALMASCTIVTLDFLFDSIKLYFRKR